MKVKLTVRRVGRQFAYEVGETIDVSVESARRLVAAGQAEMIGGEVETAAEAGSPLKEQTGAKTVHTAATGRTTKRTGNKGRPKRAS